MGITLSLIRHGEASGNWDSTVDPCLSDLGKDQADEVALNVSQATVPQWIYSSPLARARETAEPFGLNWQREIEIAPQLIEVPSAGVALTERRKWLTNVLQGRWADQAIHLQDWRANILDFARSQKYDAVFVTHFVVINSLVGAAIGSDDVVVFKPGHCSVTKILLENGQLSLIEKGEEAATVIR